MDKIIEKIKMLNNKDLSEIEIEIDKKLKIEEEKEIIKEKVKDLIPLIKKLQEKEVIIKNKITNINGNYELCNQCLYGDGAHEIECPMYALCQYLNNDCYLEDIRI
jgi:hypothetical protein